MRIAVVGAGSIGCLVGGALSTVADVTLIGRPRVMDALAAQRLRVTSYDESSRPVDHTRPAYGTDPAVARDADFVLVAVKSGATEGATQEVAAHLAPGAVLVSLQNGLRNVDVVRGALPGRVVVAGMVSFNVVQTAPTTFRQATSGTVMVGDDAAVAPLVTVTQRTWLPFEPRADMPQVQRAKLLLNLMNAVVALADRPLKECLSQRDYRRVLAACQREALVAFDADGVRPARLGLLSAAWTARVLTGPDAVFARAAATQLQVDPQARSSMWDDLQRGRPTEIEELQGAVVALGERHGVPTPVCLRIVQLVREVEAGRRRPWSGAELCSVVGLR